MKLARFKVNDNTYYGQILNNRVCVLAGNVFHKFNVTDTAYDLDDVKLLAPVLPGKVICIGLNYALHIGEYDKNLQIPEEPILFMVSPTAVVGPQEPIVLAYPEHEIHYEAELTIVIGKEGRDIPIANAADHILGYTCGNDVSDRTIQKKDGQWSRAKSFHTYKPLGPYIVTDLDSNNCQVQCRVNDELRQNGHTRDIIRNAYYLVSFISQVMTLYPGDVIMTGTPAGVGPLAAGDICEIEVEGIGVLRNPVK